METLATKVKIQCLTPKAGIRDHEGKRISMLDQECPGSVSEDNSSNSDMSENPTSGSIGSSASRNVAALSFVPASQGHHKNNGAPSSARHSGELLSPAASQPSGDVVDYLSDRSTSSAFFKGYVSAELQSFGPENHLFYPPTAAEFMNTKLSPPAKGYGAWVDAGLSQKLEAAEATIQELSEESLVWERQARKLAVEVETFRQKLAYESKVGSELKMKLSAAEAECDSLKAEAEQLKALKVAPKIRGGTHNFSRWEMEDSRRMSKVLQEEIQYEKEVNASLQMQLCKTQESNANLISTLTELEEILEASNKVVENLTEANKKLAEDLFDTRKQLETFTRTSGENAAVQSMDEVKWNHSSSSMEAIIGEKEQKKEWLEPEDKELKRQLNDTDANSIQLKSLLINSNYLNTPFKSKSEEFELQIPELEGKITILEDAVHAFEKERGLLVQKNELETDLRTQLEAEVVKLGMEIDNLALDIAARDMIIKDLNHQLADLKAKRVLLDGRPQNLLEERQVFSIGIDGEKDSVSEMLEEAHSENNRQSHRLEELVAELESSRNLLDSRASENEMLERKKTELLVIQGILEARICDLEQLSSIVNEKENVASQAVSKAADLQAEKVDLENSLGVRKERVKDLGQLSNSLEDLEIKLRDALIELEASQVLCDDLTQKLREKECVLHEQLMYHKNQEKTFQKKIGFLEEELLEKDNILSRMESQLGICKDHAISNENLDNREVKVVSDLQERLRCLEAEIKALEEELIACKKYFAQREMELMSKIECLELSNEQLAAGLNDSGAEQLQKELIRLQNQNSFLSRKEQELLSQMHTQEVLQEEVKRLQEVSLSN
ncbi:hypothetical protein L7F22_016347 [Adiantum nelumboides]|nr:hypothetical protein [Adiantum nelumboides]